ncbi:MAG: ComEC/Rec2 family competence protein [Acidimicrobiia bacterium]
MTSRARVAFGPLLVLAGLIAGIAAGEAAGPGAARVALVGGGVGVVTAAIVTRPGARVAIAVLAFGLLGTAVMQRALHGLVVSALTAPVQARDDVTVRGTLVEDPEGTRFSARVLMKVDAVGRRLLVDATGDAGPRLRLLSAGEGVTLRGWLEPLTGFDERWRWQHAVATLHANELLDARNARAPLDRLANAARGAVLRGSGSLAPVDRALLAGFLLGDRRGVPDDVTERFRLAGLTHLMAVSGENVAFVLALCAPLLRRLGLFGRLAGGVAVLALFGTMTRWEPSVLRAIAMASIALVAGYLGRPAAGLRVLALAATALLVADPFLLHSVGFLLSCGASLGIAVLARPFAARLPGPEWACEVLGVTAAAQVGVAPVLIPVFGSVPLVSLPANLVAVPLAAPLTMWGLASGVAGGVIRPFAPQIAWLLTVPTAALLHALLTVADLASRVPVTVDGRAAWGLVAIAALMAAVVHARKVRRDARQLPAR